MSEERLELARGAAPRDPEELETQAADTAAQLSPLTRLGPVHLTVSNLEQSLSYYRATVGLEPLEQSKGTLSLGRGERTVLVLMEEHGARPAYGYTGLYHFALLVPERADLARWLAHAARDRVPLQGLSDHYVSEAIYLADPDGHGIEIYWDRPREHWQGKVAERMTTLPLDVDSLLGELPDPASEPFDGLPPGTLIGHVHLKVADIPSTIAFYRDTLGFAVMAQLGSQAAFPRRRRLPPPPRPQHLGERPRRARSGRNGLAPPRNDLPRKQRGTRPGGRARAGDRRLPGGDRRRAASRRPLRQPSPARRGLSRGSERRGRGADPGRRQPCRAALRAVGRRRRGGLHRLSTRTGHGRASAARTGGSTCSSGP